MFKKHRKFFENQARLSIMSVSKSPDKKSRANRRGGFSRLDLMAMLLALTLLVSLLGSALAAVRPGSSREACQGNLKSIGQAYASFAEDHAQRMPWRLTREQGGTYGERTASGTPWVQFFLLTNYIASPKILACPADKAKVATSWGRGREGGFVNPSYRGNSISYFIGLDVQLNAPKSLLSGDRNLVVSAQRQTCDYAQISVAASLKPGDPEVKWTPEVHGDPGNILRNDGSVTAMSSEMLRAALPDTKAYHAENHILPP